MLFLVLFVLVPMLQIGIATDPNCQHTFENTGNRYDLSAAYNGSDLKSPVDNTGYQYYYISPCHNTQICANSLLGVSPVCERDGAGSLHSCGTLSSGVWQEIGNGKGVSLHYSEGEKGRKATIYYQCDPNTTGMFSRAPEDDQTKNYAIYYSTKYACPISTTPECEHTFQDTGNKYDLSPAYTGSDLKTPADNSGYQYYYISPCHNTHFCTGSACGDSPVCQQDGAGSPHSCGTLSSGVWQEIGNGKGVSLFYSGGEKSRQATIYYQCDLNTTGVFNRPPHDDQTKNYAIYYSTKYACPISTKSDCKYTFPDTGNSYDLSDAYTGKDFKSPADNTGYQYYYISPCHNTHACNGASPVCEQDGADSLWSCGTLESAVWEELGDGAGFMVTYSGGWKSRSATIYYQCDETTTGKFSQTPQDDQTKHYRLYFATKYACPRKSSFSYVNGNESP